MAYIYNMADTWADAGTTFTAIKMNVTDTASNAASLLLDLQVGGVSQFRVAKNGAVTSAARADFGDPITSGGVNAFRATGLVLGNAGEINWRSASTWSAGSTDLILARDAANTLAQRNGTNPQTFRAYNTFTDASNYERGVFDWTTQSNALTIGTQQAGSGIARSLRLITQGDGNLLFITNSVTRFDVSSLGLRATANLIWTTDNTFDIGANGANRPRDIFSSRDVYAQSNTGGFYLGAVADVAILRDDANVLALRRATNPQTFRVYNTSTDASNYERGVMGWSSNILQIGTQAAGTGSSRSVQLLAGPTVYTFNANEIFIVPAAGGMEFTGRARISSPALGIARFTEHNGANAGALELPEWAAAPAAPAANNVRIYAEDNGSGKTRLMARFATGAAVQIAIEP